MNNPLRLLDESIKGLYKKIGEKFPDQDYLNAAVVGAHFAGYSSLVAVDHFVGGVTPVAAFLYGAVVGGPDLVYSMYRLLNQTPRSHPEQTVNIIDEVLLTHNRLMRLPQFLAGVGFGVKVGYDVFMHATQGAPLDDSSAAAIVGVTSFFASATSFYLKDYDGPDIGLSTRIKEAVREKIEKTKATVLKPVPVKTFDSLDEVVS